MRDGFNVLAIVLAGCGLLPEADLEPGPSTGTAWTDLGSAVVCLGEQSFGPPSAPPGGLCVRTEATTTACESNADCGSRQICACGRCAVGYCAVTSDCVAPRFCNFAEHRCDLACGPDLPSCGPDEQCLGGVCRARCLDSTECQFGEVCDANVCIGDDCAGAADCLFGERCDVQRLPQQVLEPAPMFDGGRIILYLELADPATPDTRAIWRATGTDGIHFTVDPPVPILTGRAPSALVAGGTTYIYFEDAGALAVATSSDGIAFSPPIGVLAGDVHAPSAIVTGNAVAVYYATGDSFGLATGALGESLSDRGSILAPAAAEVGDGTPGTAFWTPITQLASPHALVAGPDRAIHVWFSAFGTESAPGEKFGMPEAIPPNFSIGFAAAAPAMPDVLAVWPYGPVADRVDAFLTHLDELGPGVVEPATGRFLLYYVDATHDATGALVVGRLGVLGSAGTEN